MDEFQYWATRRLVSSGEKGTMNRQRSLLLLAEEYEWWAPHENGENQEFSQIPKAAKVIQILSSQSLASLNQEKFDTKTLLRSFGTIIFLRSNDVATTSLAQELGGVDLCYLEIQTSKGSKNRFTQGLVVRSESKSGVQQARVVKF